jgi:flagellar biosynthesis chaperone FliJ
LVRKKTEELQAGRDRDQKYFQDQIAKLHQEIDKAKQAQEDIKPLSDRQTQGLQKKVAELQKLVIISCVGFEIKLKLKA